MAAKLLEIVLIVFFIKAAILDVAFVNDVYVNKKFYCDKALKYPFIVKSQIQCIHLCLRKNCTLINYNMKERDKENCEIFTKSSKCSTVVNQENWIATAMKKTVEVNFAHIPNYIIANLIIE